LECDETRLDIIISVVEGYKQPRFVLSAT